VYTLLSSIPKRKSPTDFFKQACDKGSKRNINIVNSEEIRKKLQPKTKKNYTVVDENGQEALKSCDQEEWLFQAGNSIWLAMQLLKQTSSTYSRTSRGAAIY